MGKEDVVFSLTLKEERSIPIQTSVPVKPYPIGEKISVEFLSYKGGSKDCTGLKSFQARGDILRFINRPGEGYTGSTQNSAYPGTSARKALAQPLSQKNPGWMTMGSTRNSYIRMYLREKFNVFEMRYTQQQFHRAKTVVVYPGGEKITLKNTTETVAYKFKRPLKTKRIQLKVLNTYDKKGVPVQHSWNLPDNFASEKRTQLSYFFRHSIWFTGSHQDQSATRTRKEFPLIGGTKISASMFQTDSSGAMSKNKCPNYFIMISPQKDVKFTFGSSEDVIKFVFNCATKYIYMPDSKDNVAKEMNVAKRSSVNWDIYVDENGVKFNDNVGGGSMKKQI